MSESAVSLSAIYSARPTLRIAGQADERVSELLTAMKMEESEGGMSTLELRFVGWVSTVGARPEIAFDGSSTLKLGADVSVYAGDEASPREIFSGKVSAVELLCTFGSPPEFVVLAEDGLTMARRGRRSKVFSEMSPDAVVNAIAGNLGLTPNITGLSTPTDTWVQLNETDLGFLRHMLSRFDADLQVVGSQLQVTPRQDVSREVIELTLNAQLARVRVCADLADQATAVTVAGWNAKDGAAVMGEASSLTHAGPGEGQDGIAWARQVFGSRSEHLGNQTVGSDSEASAVASAALDQRGRRFVRAEGVAEGNALLRVGSQVRLAGISSQFDNTYYVVHASHLFDMQHGYRVEFQADCAFLGN